MKAIAKVKITKVEEKLSSAGVPYYQIDVTEPTGIVTSTGVEHLKVWEKMYMPHSEGMENPKMLEGQTVEVIINFYPVSRSVGEKVYNEIKCNIVNFQ